MLSVESLQQILKPLFPGLMGVRIVELAPERVVAELAVRLDLCTTGGILHGVANNDQVRGRKAVCRHHANSARTGRVTIPSSGQPRQARSAA